MPSGDPSALSATHLGFTNRLPQRDSNLLFSSYNWLCKRSQITVAEQLTS